MTAQAEVLRWVGASSQPMASYYHCEPMDSRVFNAQNHLICRSIAKDGACAGRAAEPGATVVGGTPGMGAVAGALSSPAQGGFEGSSALDAI